MAGHGSWPQRVVLGATVFGHLLVTQRDTVLAV